MDGNIQNNAIKEIEFKILNGTISNEEKEEYENWYNSDQNNELFIEPYIATSKENHRLKIWNKIKHKISANHKKNIYISLIKISSIAAIFLVLILIGLKIKFHSYSDEIVNNSHDVNPGKNGLILTLDSKKINLDSYKNGVIANINGVKVIKDHNMLIYEGEALKNIYNKATTDSCMQFKIKLPDGSLVWLNSVSTLKYPLKFASNSRKVELVGEAYFEVKHNPNVPFIVHFGTNDLEVLGTHFNIKSYYKDVTSNVTLIEGKVRIINKNKSVILHPGQKAQIKLDNTIELNNTDTAAEIAWTRQKFMFNNSSIVEVMNEIKRWYGVDIVYKTDKFNQMHFSGTLSMDQKLSSVLKVLELNGIHFYIENKYVNIIEK